MNLDRRALGEKAKEMGFVRDTLEKVFRLTEILAFINSDSILSKNLILFTQKKDDSKVTLLKEKFIS